MPLLVAGAGMLLAAASASAATITVTSTADSGAGSLRQALAEASAGSTIVLPASAAHYAATSAPLAIEQSLTIVGAGARRSVIDAMQSPHRVLNITAGTVTISGVTITGAHEALEDGGGMEISGTAEVTLEQDSVSGNTVMLSGDGGGIESGPSTTLKINASMIADNIGYNGGGLLVGGTTTITNSTIIGNHGGSKGFNGDSGGMQNDKSLTLVNDTITENECFNGTGCGGGVEGGATFENDVVANNFGASETTGEVEGLSNCEGTVTTTGANLDNGGECDFAAHGGISDTNPLLGPLRDNGGPTETEDLLAGSPAIDAGTLAGCPQADQRGVTRPQGTACDIGAVEHTVPLAGTPVVSGVTATGATLTGAVSTVFIGGAFSYRYGPTATYGASTPVTPLLETPGPEAATATLSGLTPSTTYHVQLALTTPDGSAASGDVIFTTAASPPTAGPTIPTPTITNVAQSSKRWREGSKLAQLSRRGKRPPVGTTFLFSLNEPANVTLTFMHQVSGRRAGHRCVAKTRRNAAHRACKLTVQVGSLFFAGHGGANHVAFQGRLSRHKRLALGRYTLKIAASNNGGRASSPHELSFTIVK
jgi:hypothetical protein